MVNWVLLLLSPINNRFAPLATWNGTSGVSRRTENILCTGEHQVSSNICGLMGKTWKQGSSKVQILFSGGGEVLQEPQGQSQANKCSTSPARAMTEGGYQHLQNISQMLQLLLLWGFRVKEDRSSQARLGALLLAKKFWAFFFSWTAAAQNMTSAPKQPLAGNQSAPAWKHERTDMYTKPGKHMEKKKTGKAG